MPAAAVVTLVLVGLLIAALAAYLLVIAWVLHKTSRTLGTVVVGVRAIAHRTEPLEGILSDILADVSAIDEALHSLPMVQTEERATAQT